MAVKYSVYIPHLLLLFLIPCFVLLAGGYAQVPAQQASGGESLYSVKKGTNEFGVWGGGSFQSSTLIGRTEDVTLGIMGLRYARVIIAKDNMAIKYTADLIPATFLTYPKVETVQTGPGSQDTTERRTRPTVYGAGLSPVGFQINFRPRARLQPFLGASGGFLYFSDPVPTSRGTRLNFTGEVGGGLQFFMSPTRSLTIGYKYHHISNGYTGKENPGFDSNIFYAGFSIFR